MGQEGVHEQDALVIASPPPIENHLIQLLPQRLHVGIGKAGVQRAHAVGVVAGAVVHHLSYSAAHRLLLNLFGAACFGGLVGSSRA